MQECIKFDFRWGSICLYPSRPTPPVELIIGRALPGPSSCKPPPRSLLLMGKRELRETRGKEKRKGQIKEGKGAWVVVICSITRFIKTRLKLPDTRTRFQLSCKWR